MSQTMDIIGADKVGEILGVDRSTITRWIAQGKITPLQKMPGSKGAWLFDRADVEKLAAEKATA